MGGRRATRNRPADLTQDGEGQAMLATSSEVRRPMAAGH